jgi:hypothetical protein
MNGRKRRDVVILRFLLLGERSKAIRRPDQDNVKRGWRKNSEIMSFRDLARLTSLKEKIRKEF